MAPMFKNYVLPIVRNVLLWLDKESADIKGSGLSLKTGKDINNYLKGTDFWM